MTKIAEVSEDLNAIGVELRPWQTSISRERQARYHAACDIPAATFGHQADASILANDTILASRYLKTNAQDGLHAGQRLIQHEPLNFDEPLSLHGRLIDLNPIAKGVITTTRFEVRRPDGSVPVETDIISLRIDYEAMKAAGGGGKTGRKVPDDFMLLTDKPMSADIVASYSHEFPDYKVHFDPEVARSMGLRAPIAQGAMTLSWIMGEVARAGPIRTLDISVSFRQPIFWDDAVEIYRQNDRFIIANGEKDVCSTGDLASISFL